MKEKSKIHPNSLKNLIRNVKSDDKSVVVKPIEKGKAPIILKRKIAAKPVAKPTVKKVAAKKPIIKKVAKKAGRKAATITIKRAEFNAICLKVKNLNLMLTKLSKKLK